MTYANGSNSLKKLAGLLSLAVVASAILLPSVPAGAQAHDASVGLANKQIYPGIEQGQRDVKAALAEARRTHKRVLIDFGGDWCPDCQVLNYYFAQSPNAGLLSKNFVRVNVNIGHEDANINLAKAYGVPLTGVPALAVVDPSGKVVYAQNKEFSDMRHLDAAQLTEFLNKWKP